MIQFIHRNPADTTGWFLLYLCLNQYTYLSKTEFSFFCVFDSLSFLRIISFVSDGLLPLSNSIKTVYTMPSQTVTHSPTFSICINPEIPFNYFENNLVVRVLCTQALTRNGQTKRNHFTTRFILSRIRFNGLSEVKSF